MGLTQSSLWSPIGLLSVSYILILCLFGQWVLSSFLIFVKLVLWPLVPKTQSNQVAFFVLGLPSQDHFCSGPILIS